MLLTDVTAVTNCVHFVCIYVTELQCNNIKICDDADQDPVHGPAIKYLDLKTRNPEPTVSGLAKTMGLVTPVAICYDHNLGLCFFTDTHKDYIYKADVNAHTIVPYIPLKTG